MCFIHVLVSPIRLIQSIQRTPFICTTMIEAFDNVDNQWIGPHSKDDKRPSGQAYFGEFLPEIKVI